MVLDIDLTRRSNLIQAMNLLGIKSKADLARRTGRTDQQIGRLINGKIPFGKNLARAIENELGLELNYLDKVPAYHMSLSERLELAIKRAKVTKSDLARACNVQPASVSDWLSGKSKSMRAEYAIKASDFLNVNLLWLSTGEGSIDSDENGSLTNIFQIRVSNLAKILEIKNWKRTDLANALGKMPQQVNSWFTEGKGSRNIGESLAREIEEKLDIKQGVLDFMDNAEQIKFGSAFKVVHILNFNQGCLSRKNENFKNNSIAINKSESIDCLAVRVPDKSMEPKFSEGDILIIDQQKQPVAGAFVVARRNFKDGNSEMLFKQYALVSTDQDGNDIFELRSLNNIFPTFRSDIVQLDIVGVVIECRMFF